MAARASHQQAAYAYASNAKVRNAAAEASAKERLIIGLDKSSKCSRSMNELNRFSLQPGAIHCEYIDEIRRQAIVNAHSNLFAGPVIINDRILPDDEIGFKVVAKIFSRMKHKLFNSTEDIVNEQNVENHSCSAKQHQYRQLAQSVVSAAKRDHILQRMESRQSSTSQSQSKRDSIQSSTTGLSLLRRFKQQSGKTDAFSRNCSVDSHDSREIVIRVEDIALARKQYDCESAQGKLTDDSDAYSESSRPRSLSLSVRQSQNVHIEDASEAKHAGAPTECSVSIGGARRMTSPSMFTSSVMLKSSRESVSAGNALLTDATPLKSMPACKQHQQVAECSYDKHGMTWDIYGADVDAEILGELIQHHLQKLMLETRIEAKVCAVAKETHSHLKQDAQRKPFVAFGIRLLSACCLNRF